MKHLILGDVHLGRSLNIGKPASGGNLNSRIQDQLNLLNWVKDLAEQKGCKHIIVTGDVYEDSRPHPAIINYFMDWSKKCSKDGFTLDIIDGNHDIVRTGNYVVSALDIIPTVELDSVNVYKKPATQVYPNVTISYMPFRDKRMYEVADTQEALEKLKQELSECTKPDPNKVNILVGHLAIDKSLSVGDEITDQSNEIFVPIDMFDNFDYVWMGHIHHYQVLKEKPHISHIGSMDRSDFSANEIDKDKFVVIYDDDIHKFELIKIPTRSLIKESVRVPEDKDSTEFVIKSLSEKHDKTSFTDSIFRLEILLNGQNALSPNKSKILEHLYNEIKVHHVPNIYEIRCLEDIKSSDELFDTSIDDTRADVKKWKEAHNDDFENDEERDLFTAFTNRCIEKFEEINP